RQRRNFAGIANAHGPPRGLRSTEINARFGRSVAAIAVEDQVAGLEMDGILQLSRSGLIGRGDAGGVGLQINLHFAAGSNVAGLRIEGEIVAVDLIEARRVATVENDGDILQIGPSVELEFLHALSPDGKDRASGLGF